MSRNRFTNPANGDFYDWILNHTDEEAFGKARNITESAPTGNVGLVKQQGSDGPLVKTLSGTILDRSQYKAMWEWFVLSGSQTIYFTDFDGQQFEVQITSFLPQLKRKLTSASRDPSMPNSYWSYTIAMEVYGLIAGDLADAGVTP